MTVKKFSFPADVRYMHARESSGWRQLQPKGGTTIAYYMDRENGCVDVAVAFCRDDEHYVKAAGRLITLERLTAHRANTDGPTPQFVGVEQVTYRIPGRDLHYRVMLEHSRVLRECTEDIYRDEVVEHWPSIEQTASARMMAHDDVESAASFLESLKTSYLQSMILDWLVDEEPQPSSEVAA